MSSEHEWNLEVVVVVVVDVHFRLVSCGVSYATTVFGMGSSVEPLPLSTWQSNIIDFIFPATALLKYQLAGIVQTKLNMSAGRPLWRPSIRDLQRYLFSPRIQPPAHCISHLTCQSELTKASVIWQSQRKPNRPFSTSSARFSSPKPKSHDRGPPSAEDTQTDFGALNVLGSTPIPSTSIDACLWDGFHLNSGVKITGGAGVLLVAGEAFSWRPWEARKGDLRLVNNKGQWDVEDGAWGLFELLWPKPGMLKLHF